MKAQRFCNGCADRRDVRHLRAGALPRFVWRLQP
jgi:hypothetical protein